MTTIHVNVWNGSDFAHGPGWGDTPGSAEIESLVEDFADELTDGDVVVDEATGLQFTIGTDFCLTHGWTEDDSCLVCDDEARQERHAELVGR